jgi:hypothetical protein
MATQSPGTSFREGSVAKGLFTQGVAVLMKAAPKIDELVPLLDGFEIAGRREASESWTLGGPSLLLEYRPKANGCIQIDVVDRPWPDAMNSPDDPSLLAAQTMGFFGPFCYPGSLQRACQHCYTWADGPATVQAHKAFLRVRVSYALDAAPEDAALPRNYRPFEEGELMLGVVEALLEHPAALCYFNPNGEVLSPLDRFAEICDHYRQAGLPAVNLLANRRMVKFEGTAWMMMDTVGLGQVDMVDLECCFSDRYDPNEVAVFLVNTALQMAKPGSPKIKDGHTLTGIKGVLFEAKRFEQPLLGPPRPVVRFRPRDGTASPVEMGFGDKPFGKSAWWQFWKL